MQDNVLIQKAILYGFMLIEETQELVERLEHEMTKGMKGAKEQLLETIKRSAEEEQVELFDALEGYFLGKRIEATEWGRNA